MRVAKGFLFNAVKAGIKAPEKWDVGLILSEVPCGWAGVFTHNDFQAGPVLL